MDDMLPTVHHARAWLEEKHRRDQHGRFADGASPPSLSPNPRTEEPKRSLTRGEGWQRLATREKKQPFTLDEDPTREHAAGSFTRLKWTDQQPRNVRTEDHLALRSRLINIVKRERKSTIERGYARKLIPDGTEPRSVHRAYNHASMLAMHKFGVSDYDFSMDDHLKGEMRPLVPFMRYAHRKVKDMMFAENKGAWKPYRQAFGKPFADQRRDKEGNIRLRVRPNEEFVKRAPLAKSGPTAPDTLKPGVLAPQQGVSRWDRYRAYLARDEHIGQHDLTPLTPNQRQERRRAGLQERMKIRSGALMLQRGQPGSLKGLSIGNRRYTAIGADPGADGTSPMRPNIPAGPHIPSLAPPSVASLWKRAPAGMHPAAYAVMPDGLKHIVEPPPADPDFPHHVAAVMPHVHRILSNFQGFTTHAQKQATRRHARSKLIADDTVPLSRPLGA